MCKIFNDKSRFSFSLFLYHLCTNFLCIICVHSITLLFLTKIREKEVNGIKKESEGRRERCLLCLQITCNIHLPLNLTATQTIQPGSIKMLVIQKNCIPSPLPVILKDRQKRKIKNPHQENDLNALMILAVVGQKSLASTVEMVMHRHQKAPEKKLCSRSTRKCKSSTTKESFIQAKEHTLSERNNWMKTVNTIYICDLKFINRQAKERIPIIKEFSPIVKEKVKNSYLEFFT